MVSLFAVLAVGGCTANPSVEDNDPFEPVNRVVFDVNNAFDKAVALPVAKTYVDVVPEFARTGVHNVLTNLDTPVTLANDVLQGEIERAGQSLGRIVINSTVGIAGLIDIAAEADLPPHSEDMGQTLATYGVTEGPYLVLPFLGPSTVRDTAGIGIDNLFDPLTYARYDDQAFWTAMRFAGKALDLRSQNIDTLDAVERSSIDYYAALRSLYRQQRNSEIDNGKASTPPLPEY